MEHPSQLCFELKISFEPYKSRGVETKSAVLDLVSDFSRHGISVVEGFADGLDLTLGDASNGDVLFETNDDTSLLCYAEDKPELERLGRMLENDFPLLKMSLRGIPNALWQQPWRDMQDVITDKFILTTQPVVDDFERIRIKVNYSEIAFGDGRHVTTRLLLKLLESRFQCKRDKRVLDIGTGNAVLAIAMAKLGAAHVLATDIDNTILAEARLNSVVNEVDEQIDLRLTSSVPRCRVSFITCNILAPELLRMIPKAYEVLEQNGEILLSGFNEMDQAQVTATCESLGLTLKDQVSESGWLAMAFSRNGH